MNRSCVHCGEVCHGEAHTVGIIKAVDGVTTASVGLAHSECLTRSVLGGWGHFEDHAFWCEIIGDPDGGLTYRESALRVQRAMDRGELTL